MEGGLGCHKIRVPGPPQRLKSDLFILPREYFQARTARRRENGYRFSEVSPVNHGPDSVFDAYFDDFNRHFLSFLVIFGHFFHHF